MRNIVDAVTEGWAPYLIGIIAISVVLHVLTIRFVIAQMKVIGNLSHDKDELTKELDERG